MKITKFIAYLGVSVFTSGIWLTLLFHQDHHVIHHVHKHEQPHVHEHAETRLRRRRKLRN